MKQKVKRKQYSREQMQRAIDAVVNHQFTFIRAANMFGVPKTTLLFHVKKFVKKEHDVWNLTEIWT